MKKAIGQVCLAAAALCASPALAHDDLTGGDHEMPAGSNEMLRAPLSGAPDLEVIISDVVIPAGAQVPRHYHPGEEFLYVIEGSATHVEEGQPDRPLNVGDSYVIAPRRIHEPIGGPEGARAIVFRVHVKDQPERVLVPREEADTPAE